MFELLQGFDISSLLTWQNILFIFFGTFIGMLIGALPGMGAPLAIVLLLPLTYSLEPLTAILMLLATYQGAEYGGSISAIVLGIPGTPAAAATVLDGRPLAKKSSPGKALAYSLTASTVGGFFGGLVLIFLSIPLVALAMNMGDPEFFLIGILGLVIVAGLSSTDLTRSFMSIIIGLMAGTVGMDMLSGVNRFTLGFPQLLEGVNLIALLVGLFAFSEMFFIISKDLHKRFVTDHKGLSTKITFKEIKSVTKSMLIGSASGSTIGVLPGMGAGTAAWFSYMIVKKRSKKKNFGKGNPEGIAAPESANNATVGGSLVPLLSLGIPGSPATAIIMGAFIIHGIQPGPSLFDNDINLVLGIFFGFLLTTVAMFIVGKAVTIGFSRVLTIPNRILVPTILLFSLIGIFAGRHLEFDLWYTLIIGIIGYVLIRIQFSIPSFILAFILSPIIEKGLRRTLILSDNSYMVFITRPMSIILLTIIIVMLVFSFVRYRTENK